MIPLKIAKQIRILHKQIPRLIRREQAQNLGNHLSNGIRPPNTPRSCIPPDKKKKKRRSPLLQVILHFSTKSTRLTRLKPCLRRANGSTVYTINDPSLSRWHEHFHTFVNTNLVVWETAIYRLQQLPVKLQLDIASVLYASAICTFS